MLKGISCFIGSPDSVLKCGNGKTLAMVNELYTEYLKGRTIYTNLNLNFEHHKIESFMDVLDHQEAVIGIDEINSFVGSIYTQAELPAKVKSDLALFMDQHRKRDIDLIYTNQHYITTAKLIRVRTNYLNECYKYHNVDNVLLPCYNPKCTLKHVYIIKVSTINGNFIKKYAITNPEALYKYYDTYQIVTPITDLYKKKGKT